MPAELIVSNGKRLPTPFELKKSKIYPVMTKFFPFIDTHTHLDLADFDPGHDELMERTGRGQFPELVQNGGDEEVKSVGIRPIALINPSISLESSQRVVELARRWEIIRPAIGIHPNYSAQAAPDDWDRIELLANDASIVAIGETGLDLFWDYSPLPIQKEFLWKHIELARRLSLPLSIHCRDAWEELHPILKEIAGQVTGVIHSFSGDRKTAEQCIEWGFYIGFSGAVTYTGKKFAALWETASAIPLNRIVLETDSPFLTPHPFRGKLQRNEPMMTAFTAKRIAQLRDVPISEIFETTTANALELFKRIPRSVFQFPSD